MSGYIVVETAVYNHRIAGTFDTLDDATAHAAQWALTDDCAFRDDQPGDGHHEYLIFELGDEPAELEDPIRVVALVTDPTGPFGYGAAGYWATRHAAGHRIDPDGMVTSVNGVPTTPQAPRPTNTTVLEE